MESIIEFIFSNFIIVLLIIGGISKLLGGDKEEQQKRQRTNQPNRQPGNRRQVPTHSKTSQEMQRPTKPIPKAESSTTAGVPASVEDQQQQQLERLAGQMKARGKQAFEDLSEEVDFDKNLKHHALSTQTEHDRRNDDNYIKNKTMKKQMKKKLTRKGLKDSIIMAEVLGPPRARKPYKSIISERSK